MKLKFFILATLITLALTNENASLSDKSNSLQDDCSNPCASCQRAIYQLKFHQMADCGVSHCRNTCYKVKELWAINDGVFKGFRDDIFGKCEICFRAGFCSIAECKVQQEKEAEVIDSIINSSKITGKKEDIIAKAGLDKLTGDKEIYTKEAIDGFSDDVKKIHEQLEQEINAAFGDFPIEKIEVNIQNLINTNFSKESTFSGSAIDAAAKEKVNKDEAINLLDSSNKSIINNSEKILTDKNVDETKRKDVLENLQKIKKENETLLNAAKNNDPIVQILQDAINNIDKLVVPPKAPVPAPVPAPEKPAETQNEDSLKDKKKSRKSRKADKKKKRTE